MTTVQWKDEGEVDGVPIGPVFVNGEEALGTWVSKHQAQEMADELEVKLEEV